MVRLRDGERMVRYGERMVSLRDVERMVRRW